MRRFKRSLLESLNTLLLGFLFIYRKQWSRQRTKTSGTLHSRANQEWLCKLSSGWTLSHDLVAWSSISHIWFLLELRKSSRTFVSLIVIYYVAVYCLCLVHLLRIF